MLDELSSTSIQPKRLTLSVFIPNYNHGHLLERAVRAVMQQSRPPDEVVVIDDASTDGSVEVIRSLQKQFANLRLIQNPHNQGVLRIMERIPGELTGDYIYGGAADDAILPGFFAAAMQYAEQYPEAGIIFGQIPTYDTQGRLLHVAKASGWQRDTYASPQSFLTEYLEREMPSHSLSGATLFRRQALLEIGGFRPELQSWADSFAVRALGLKYGAVYIAQPCMVWTVYPNSVSQVVSRTPALMFPILRRAVKLMCSTEFKDIFPAPHVRRWVRRYRIAVIEQWLLSRLGWSVQMWLARQHILRSVRDQLYRLFRV